MTPPSIENVARKQTETEPQKLRKHQLSIVSITKFTSIEIPALPVLVVDSRLPSWAVKENFSLIGVFLWD